jgi:hypothetical protein
MDRKLMTARVEKLIDVVDRTDEMPDEVHGAINDLLDSIEDDSKKVPWWKAPFFKGGKFSKTATFATLANCITLVWYAMSMFATGEPWDMGFITLPAIKPLDPTLAVGVLSALNGTYLINNKLKNGAANG